jgi:hypothetical protein
VLALEANLNEKKYNNPLGISGLGGWLILVQIGLYGTIIIQLIQFFEVSLITFDADFWNMVTSKESELYHPLLGTMIGFETVINIGMILFSGFILFNFYGRKSILPRLIIIFYCIIPLYGIIDYALLQQISITQELENTNSLRNLIRST